MRNRRGPGKCEHLNMFDHAPAHACSKPRQIGRQTEPPGTKQRRLQQQDDRRRIHLFLPCYYTYTIPTPWWMRSTGSKACLLLTITVTLLHVLPLLILTRGRQKGGGGNPEEKRYAVHKVSRPLLKSEFLQFLRITSDSCMCNCCDHWSVCVWLCSVFLNPVFMCNKAYAHLGFIDGDGCLGIYQDSHLCSKYCCHIHCWGQSR